MAAVCLAAHRWAPLWRNHRIVIFTDNTVTEAVINNGCSTNRMLQTIIKELCYLALRYNFSISASHISTVDNTISDPISRLHERGQLAKFVNILYKYYDDNGMCPPTYYLFNHMSYKSYMSVSPQLHL
jgi:hypothetical protein